jgi:hypothetical protein
MVVWFQWDKEYQVSGNANASVKSAKKWLAENRSLFLELEKKLENPKRLRTLLLELYRFLDPILKIDASSEPHAAMFAVGQIQGGVESVFADIMFYQEYLRRQAEYERIVNDESSQEGEHSANPNRRTVEAVAI